tara:strand:+ start:682 stop:1458 length:777 start_codon:yes stop_codon:yes gene_type:complete
MAGKLWVVGDSFFARNRDNNSGKQLPGASWIDTFVANCELDFDWDSNSWSKGGNTNSWNLYGLYTVRNNPQYNCDTDTILFGATSVDRSVTSANTELDFDINIGKDNLLDRVKCVTVHEMLCMNDQEQRNEAIISRQWDPVLLNSARHYYSTNWDHNWQHFTQCNWIDSTITDMRHSGSDIVFHRGCMYMWDQGLSLELADQQTTDPLYQWRNTDLFDVPSFTLGMDSMDDVFKYNSHMSPDGAERYGNTFTEWYKQR